MALYVLWPVYLVGKTPDGRIDSTTVVLLVVLVVSGARLSWIMAGGEARLAELAIGLFAFVFVATPGLVQHRELRYPGTTPGIYSQFDGHAALAVALALSALAIGLGRGGRDSVAPESRMGSRARAAATSRLNRGIKDRRLPLFATLSLLAALAYGARTGVGNLLSDRETVSLARAAAFSDPTLSAIALGLGTMPLLVSIHAMTHTRRSRAQRGDSRGYAVLLALSIATLLVTVNPLTSPRYILGTTLFSLLVLWGGYRTPRRGRWTTFAIIAAMLVIFPTLGSAFRNDASQVAFVAADIPTYIDSGDYDAFAQTNNAMLFVDQRGIVWGDQALGVVGFWVSRDIWPGKPIDTGVLLAQFRGYQFPNLSAPLWAESYINFGWPGIAVVFLGLGWLLGRLTREAQRTEPATAATIGLAVLSFYLFILLRGSLLQAAGTLAVVVLSVWVITGGRPRISR